MSPEIRQKALELILSIYPSGLDASHYIKAAHDFAAFIDLGTIPSDPMAGYNVKPVTHAQGPTNTAAPAPYNPFARTKP
jgi:hypothetical protein